MTDIERELLLWLGEMDGNGITTGLLGKAFEAGWHACEATKERESDHDAVPGI